jgi:hypothetical protein
MSKKHKVHKNWEERTKYLIAMGQKQIEDLHKTRDFIIERAYKLIGVQTIATTFILHLCSAPKVVLAIFAIFSMGIFFLYFIPYFLSTSDVMDLGLKPNLISIETTTKKGIKEHTLDTSGYFLEETTSDSNYYAWLVNEMTRQYDYMKNRNEEISAKYKEMIKYMKLSVVSTFIAWGLYYLLLLLGVKAPTFLN